jgi:hypothetical protein
VVLEPKFEPATARIRSRNVVQWTLTFSDELILTVCLSVCVCVRAELHDLPVELTFE